MVSRMSKYHRTVLQTMNTLNVDISAQYFLYFREACLNISMLFSCAIVDIVEKPVLLLL